MGIFPFLKGLEQKRYKQYIRVFLRQYQLAHTCPVCHGSRLNEQALSVEIGGAVISSVSAKPVDELATWLEALSLSDFEREIAHLILDQLQRRIGYLRDVGLGYLTLDRLTRTLSGGEAQRIALANALGSNLVDALYVLDEPSIGLHPRDIDRLLGLLQRLRDTGNTVIVVEHDPAAIARADFMLELGPAPARTVEGWCTGPLAGATESLTGQYLSGQKRIGIPSARRPLGPWLRASEAPPFTT
jgi:excinuclease ABC subunit A